MIASIFGPPHLPRRCRNVSTTLALPPSALSFALFVFLSPTKYGVRSCRRFLAPAVSGHVTITASSIVLGHVRVVRKK